MAVRESLLKQTFRDFEWLVDVNWTGEVDFNAATNRLIRRANGELVVFVQDYVELPDDALQKFWGAHISAPAFYTVPVVHYDEKNERSDWRMNTNGAVQPEQWEIDCGSAPRDALFAIGGFDEYLDKRWGYDNVSVGIRAAKHGYDIRCLNTIVCRAWDHNMHKTHEFRHLQDLDFVNQRLEYTRQRIVDIGYL